jgi:hypothetical protein
MTAGLQEQRIGNDSADGGRGQKARDRVLRAVQEDPHQQAAFFGLDGSRLGATAAARHLVVHCRLSRHFSSPDKVVQLV